MPAPTPASSRPTPSGIKLDDGFSTEFVFSAAPNIGFWEKMVTPPGLDGGEPINTTTMHNIRWRTMAPRALVSMSPFEARVAYDPLLFAGSATAGSLLALLNVKNTITLFFPDNSKLAFFGFLQKFVSDQLEEGKQPEAVITVVPTNQDPTDGTEQDPVLVNVVGT